MNVADSSPASWPAVASSISTSKPRRSAHRWYIRSSISHQSWASVPPAPGVELGDGVVLVVLAGEEGAQLEIVEAAGQVVDEAGELAGDGVVALLHHQLVEDLGVGEASTEVLEQRDVVADGTELRGDPAGRVGVVPQVGARDLLLELGPPGAQVVEAQVALGLLETQSAAPPVRP